MVEGVWASKSLHLDTLCQCRGAVQDAIQGSKMEEKVREKIFFEKATVIYCTTNSPGITRLA